MRSEIPSARLQGSCPDRPPVVQSRAFFWIAAAAVPLAAVMLGRALPLPVAVPVFGIAMILTGFAVWAASCLLQSKPATARASVKDVAGMLVLIGCAATIMTDGELAIRAFDALLANGAGPALQADGAGLQNG